MRSKKFLASVAVVSALSIALTACGGGDKKSDPKSTGEAVGQNTDINKFVSIKETPYEQVAEGGVLRLSLGNIGPNFNGWSNDGNTSDNSMLHQPMDNAGCMTSDLNGKGVVNPDYCTAVEEKMVDGKQTIIYTLNEKAKFNDGTPMDLKMFQNQWKVLNGSDATYTIVQAAPYDRIESVEQGEKPNQIVVKMKEVFEPYTDIFSGFLHPAVNTPEIFNNGFVDELHPEWMSGPFKLEKYDKAQKSVSMVPNEKWWGQKPKLAQIVFTQMEAKADLAAYKNGQINATGVATLSRLEGVKDVPNNEYRRGMRTGTFGLVLNTKSDDVKDIAVRKAIYQVMDRKSWAGIRFKGLDWAENAPGSWLLMPISPGYQDNYPVKDNDPEGAKKTLTEAGYAMGSDGFFAKDGKTLQVRMTTFGDDPTGMAQVQFIQKTVKNAGIKMDIDQRPSGDFGKAFAKRDFAISFSGYSMGSDAVGPIDQFYTSTNEGNYTGCGDPALDERIKKAPSVVDHAERQKNALAIEKDWQTKCFAMLPATNGPQITAVNKYLVNFGPQLFRTRDWTKIGWEKGHVDGK